MRPTRLPSDRVEGVVGPPAVGDCDPGELLSEQRERFPLVPVGRDPEHRRPFCERAPEGAFAALQAPAGLVDVDRVGAADLAE